MGGLGGFEGRGGPRGEGAALGAWSLGPVPSEVAAARGVRARPWALGLRGLGLGGNRAAFTFFKDCVNVLVHRCLHL